MFLRIVPILIALLLTTEAFAAGHGNDGYPHNRLFLQESGQETGQYRQLCFKNLTDVGNFYGVGDPAYTLAQEYFASPVPPRTQYCATRFPGILQARAHLWGANRKNSLAALKAASGRLNLNINGGWYWTCLGTGTGCLDLSTETTFAGIATDIQCALKAATQGSGGSVCNGQTVYGSGTPHMGSFNGSVSNVSVTFNATNVAATGAWINIASPSGTVYAGMMVCVATNPCTTAASDYIGQIVGQYNYLGGTVGGAGSYGLFLPPNQSLNNTALVATGAILTLGSALSTPYGYIEVGQTLVDKTNTGYFSPNTNVWACISGCNQIGPNPPTSGAQYFLNLQPTGTVSGDLIWGNASNPVINWNQQTGVTKSWGYLYINESNLAPAVNSSTAYATGSAADALGLAQGSVGDDSTLPNTDAFNSSEPSVYYPSVASFMNSLLANTGSNWQSCQFTQDDNQQPQNAAGITLAMIIDQWAQTTPNIQCPGGYNGGPSWMTTPASTPAANAFAPMTNSSSWAASYTPGLTYNNNYDSGSQYAGGTEGRTLAALNVGSYVTPTDPATAGQALLFLGLGYWEDTPGSEGQQNAQIMIKNTPTGPWKVDYNFGDFCPSSTNTTCALAVSYMSPLTWLFDASGAPVNLQTMEAGIWWQGGSGSTPCYLGSPPPTNPTPVYNFTRNTVDNTWYSSLIVCNGLSTVGVPQVRSIGTHVDQVLSTTSNGVQYAFAGEVSGIYHGQLKHPQVAGQDMIDWSGGGNNCETYNSACPAEFYTSQSYVGPACSHESRTMALAEAIGPDGVSREYASICFSVFVRIDGPQSSCNPDQVYISGACQQRWQLYWSAPTYNTSSPSGLRGLTNIGGNLLTGVEGARPQNYWNIPPLPGCASVSAGVVTITSTTCATSELDVAATTSSYLGMNTTDQVAVYNHFDPYMTTDYTLNYFAPQSVEISSAKVPTGRSNTLIQLYNSSQTPPAPDGSKLLGEGLYTVRSPSGVYAFNQIPQLFSTPMGAVREMIASPFTSDCPVNNFFPNGGCAFYATNFDPYTYQGYTWCMSAYSPSSQCGPVTSPANNVHNTATAVRYGTSNTYNVPVWTPPMAGLLVYPGCSMPTPAPGGTQWYVDWNTGNDSNSGTSPASPLKSLQNLLSGISKTFVAGDTINLNSGPYGDITLPTTSTTAGFSTIQAASGQTPVLTSLSGTGVSKWNLTGLKVQSNANAYAALVSFANSNNVVVNAFDISSQANVSSWTQAQWLSNARYTGINISGNSASSCMSVVNNKIYNVINGVTAWGANSWIAYNTVNNLGGDFVDIGYNNMAVVGNTMTNANYLGNGAHLDFVQMFVGGNVNFASLSNIMVSGNTMIRQTSPTSVAFPWGIQGVDAFIDSWTNVNVTNNVLITSAANGITIGGASNVLITNNTVLDDQSNVYETLQGGTCCLYIQAGVAYNNVQPASRNVIVRNNVASQFSLGSLGSQGVADHNYTFTAGTSGVFNNFSPTAYQFDVSPAAGSVLYNAGSATMSPTTDTIGVTRTATPTIGAYQ